LECKVIAFSGFLSLAPDVSDPLVSDRSIDNGVRDRAMAHESLKHSCIDSSGRQGVSGSMAKHVSMNGEWHLCGQAKAFYELLGAVDR
jgi:hypothetical protein